MTPRIGGTIPNPGAAKQAVATSAGAGACHQPSLRAELCHGMTSRSTAAITT